MSSIAGWVLVAMFYGPNVRQVAMVTIPMQSELACRQAYESMRQEWKSLIVGGQCVKTG